MDAEMSTLEIKLSGEDVLPFIKQQLIDAGIEIGDITGGAGYCYVCVDVKKRQRSDLEQGFEILDVCDALHSSRHIMLIKVRQ